ncbi:MAG TPA: Dyp-type peroxidase [Polyangiaceae bacterium]|nr:Dyp-type peroxidase [Polyangiaceae bacterium]
MTELEKNDIQGLVFSGYPKNDAASYLMLEVVDPGRARAWLGRIAGLLTAGEPRDYEVTMNLAVTARGLSALGLPKAAIETFSREFREGMAGEEHRSRVLGDTDDSDPSLWLWGARRDPGERPKGCEPIHVMLLVFALDEATLTGALAAERARYAGALREVFVRDTVALPGRREHFGFADGIAQPTIAGSRAGEKPGAQVIKAGEFVFGYPNEYDKLPVSPSVPEALDAGQNLGVARGGAKVSGRDFGHNGTYLVVRQLEQDVARFWGAMADYSRDSSGNIDREGAIKLASKCVGRWPSGAPLVKSPDRDDPKLGNADDFLYAREDPRGLACPIGSHIRRTNPRDSLEPTPEESLEVVDRHRIIRRGRSYGKPLEPFAHETEKTERGLFFACINTNIRRQFEFIQQTWSNNPKFAGLYRDKDPIIGDQPPGDGGTYTIPEAPVRRRLEKLSRFVRVRGGEYFFLPSIRAVRFLAALEATDGVKRADRAAVQETA